MAVNLKGLSGEELCLSLMSLFEYLQHCDTSEGCAGVLPMIHSGHYNNLCLLGANHLSHPVLTECSTVCL